MRALLMCNNPTINALDIVNGRALARDNWLSTVIKTSLLTDRRAQADEMPDGETDARGYWGDTVNANVFSDSHGSLLWTLKREKITALTLQRMRSICLDALSWLVRGAYVNAIDVTLTRVGAVRVDIVVRADMGGEVLEQTEVFNAV